MSNESCPGIGGAPTRATVLPDSAAERKKFPVASGLLDYFPDACAVVANVSYIGNEQHNTGKPLHWDRTKSGDEADTLLRHFLQRGNLDKDGTRHSAKMAWRALALLQKELEAEKAAATTAPVSCSPLCPVCADLMPGYPSPCVERVESYCQECGSSPGKMHGPKCSRFSDIPF